MQLDGSIIAVGVAALGLALQFNRAHRENIERFTRLETKLDAVYKWWESRVNTGWGDPNR